MRRILELNHTEARQYFLKAESYVKFDLPKYFDFQKLIADVSTAIVGRPIEDFYLNPPDYTKAKPKAKHPFPSDFEDINYKLLNNKDGKFAWRPFQLIHPVLYVSLVHEITEEKKWSTIVDRFGCFAANSKIKCYSIPLQSDGTQSDKATTVSQWWQTIEQQSIELALEYEYVLHTDISDCYGSIYTHSIPWAIHKKEEAKKLENRKNYSLIGNLIDRHVQDMAFGQTNGIPQGSILMDFIAEMVLGYADTELSIRIQQANIQDYHIIRYRDDYRIFSNNPQTAELITKMLTEVLIDLGMRLNAQKTLVSNNVIRDSIKPDKIYWITQKNESRSIQEHLLLIHNLSDKFPNSGSLTKALGKFYDRLTNLTVMDFEIKNELLRIIRIIKKCSNQFSNLIQKINRCYDKIENLKIIDKKKQTVLNKLVEDISKDLNNIGTLSTQELSDLEKLIHKFVRQVEHLESSNILALVSIIVDIMYKNPNTYPITSAILSKCLSLLNDPTKRDAILQSIMVKFEKIPNTGHIKIWLQRLTIKIDRQRFYQEKLCEKVNDSTIQIWDSEWLNDSLKTLINTTPIIDEQIIENIDIVIDESEVQLFKTEYGDYVENNNPNPLKKERKYGTL